MDISKGLGVLTKCVLSKMDTPIGFAIGNAVEVEESLLCLRGEASEDILNLVTTLGGVLLQVKGFYLSSCHVHYIFLSLLGRVDTLEEGKVAVADVISSGLALKHFEKMLISQGVDRETARQLCNGNHKDILPKAPFITRIPAHMSGMLELRCFSVKANFLPFKATLLI